ncbi:MAG: DoxX family protein [Nitrospiraceae bacterium]
MHQMFSTDDSVAPLMLRVGLGSVMFAHGAQKLLGWFGGNGFDGTMGFFTGALGLPWIIGFLVIVGESFGAVGLMAGCLTRFTAASFIVIMLGAIPQHWAQGFFMNWFGHQQGEGFEFHMLVIAMSLALLVTGGGKWSVDGAIARQLEAQPAMRPMVKGEAFGVRS